LGRLWRWPKCWYCLVANTLPDIFAIVFRKYGEVEEVRRCLFMLRMWELHATIVFSLDIVRGLPWRDGKSERSGGLCAKID